MNKTRCGIVLSSLCVGALGTLGAATAQGAVMETIKAAKAKLDEAANQPVKIKVSGSGKLVDNEKDVLAVIDGFKKKIRTTPVMAFGVSFDPFDRVAITYQTGPGTEVLQSIGYEKGVIEGKPRPFKLLGKAKVVDNVFDIDKVKFNLIPALIKEARKRTTAETKAKNLYGVTINIGQSRISDNRVGPVRIGITIATDGKSVGYMTASESGEVLEFRVKS